MLLSDELSRGAAVFIARFSLMLGPAVVLWLFLNYLIGNGYSVEVFSITCSVLALYQQLAYGLANNGPVNEML
jgi:hypothetical protein